jgi:riboflavin kinase
MCVVNMRHLNGASDVQVYKMCMSIGWNPFYQNKEKTAEPWILHDFDKVC